MKRYVNILDLALPYLYGSWDLEKFFLRLQPVGEASLSCLLDMFHVFTLGLHTCTEIWNREPPPLIDIIFGKMSGGLRKITIPEPLGWICGKRGDPQERHETWSFLFSLARKFPYGESFQVPVLIWADIGWWGDFFFHFMFHLSCFLIYELYWILTSILSRTKSKSFPELLTLFMRQWMWSPRTDPILRHVKILSIFPRHERHVPKLNMPKIAWQKRGEWWFILWSNKRILIWDVACQHDANCNAGYFCNL